MMIDKNLTFTVETTALYILYSVNKNKSITGILISVTWCSINTDHTDSYVEQEKDKRKC